MEVRGTHQDNSNNKDQMGSLGFDHDPSNNRDSSSRKDQFFLHPSHQNQTLDHHHHHQLSLRQQQTRKSRRVDPDPVSAPIAETTTTTTTTTQPLSPSPPQQTTSPPPTAAAAIRYRECLKNHAASMGGHVVDGCGEFMPSGEEGTLEALKCAACECHRNFHRKEVDGQSQYSTAGGSCCNYTYTPRQKETITITPLPPPPPTQHHHHSSHHRFSSHHHPSSVGPIIAPVMMAFGGGGGAAESSSEDLNNLLFQQQQQQPKTVPFSKKRFRTKFSGEQKEKMMEFAEKIGWKIQKQNEQEVHHFCAQLGLKRQVFKVWMHNKKQIIKKKSSSSS